MSHRDTPAARELLEKFSIALQEQMWLSNLSARELGAISGVAFTCISRIIAATQAPTLSTIAAIAKGLDCEVRITFVANRRTKSESGR